MTERDHLYIRVDGVAPEEIPKRRANDVTDVVFDTLSADGYDVEGVVPILNEDLEHRLGQQRMGEQYRQRMTDGGEDDGVDVIPDSTVVGTTARLLPPLARGVAIAALFLAGLTIVWNGAPASDSGFFLMIAAAALLFEVQSQGGRSR